MCATLRCVVKDKGTTHLSDVHDQWWIKCYPPVNLLLIKCYPI